MMPPPKKRIAAHSKTAGFGLRATWRPRIGGPPFPLLLTVAFRFRLPPIFCACPTVQQQLLCFRSGLFVSAQFHSLE